MELTGQVALVTGGAVRIGAAICRALAAAGCHVVVHYDRSRAEAKALAGELRRGGVRAECLGANLTRPRQAAALVDRAWERMGRLDILINNAAVFHKDRLVDADEDRIRADLELNLMAPVLATRRLAELLAGARAADGEGHGCVVNLLDRRVSGVEAGCVPYLLSKLALADFTRAAALDLAPDVRVNAVAPGAVLPPPGKGMAYLKDAAGFIPLRTRTTPADVASAVIYLVRSGSMTGQILYIDGGQHLCSVSPA
jgi:NAD(P)-dependent dehydrogenase (short-subunit alcohol dehydrogenase family)